MSPRHSDFTGDEEAPIRRRRFCFCGGGTEERSDSGGKKRLRAGEGKQAACFPGMAERARQRALAWGLTTVCHRELVSEQASVVEARMEASNGGAEPSRTSPHTLFPSSLYLFARGDSGRGLPGAPDNALDTYACQRARRVAFPGAPALYFHAQLFVCWEGCSPGLRWPVGVSISVSATATAHLRKHKQNNPPVDFHSNESQRHASL